MASLNLQELVLAVEEELRVSTTKSVGECEKLKELLMRYDANLDDLAPFNHLEPLKHYTRNLISTDHKTYTLILLCWNPKRERFLFSPSSFNEIFNAFAASQIGLLIHLLLKQPHSQPSLPRLLVSSY